MTDAELLQHLVDYHQGVHVPWFVGSGFILRLDRAQLDGLHDVLVAGGESCKTMASRRGCPCGPGCQVVAGSESVQEPHSLTLESGEDFEWRAVCSCGWSGPVRSWKYQASADGDEHRR